MDFKTSEELNGTVIVIEAPERLEGNTSIEFRKKIIETVDKNNYQIIIDLKKTKFMDSNGISSLVSRISVTKSNNGDIRLASPSEFVRNILKITHLDMVFKYFPDLKTAIDSFN